MTIETLPRGVPVLLNAFAIGLLLFFVTLSASQGTMNLVERESGPLVTEPVVFPMYDYVTE